MDEMTEIHVLIVEDSEDDATLILARLRGGGLDATYDRVDTPEAITAALITRPPDLIICDYHMPTCRAEDALDLLHSSGLDIPFILVSGKVGEETAAALMRAGADDFLLKDHLTRLVPAVQRELREAVVRGHHRRAEAALRESEERFRLLAEHAQDVIFRYRHRPLARVEYLSPAITALTGYRPEELYGDPATLFSLVDAPDRARFAASWRTPRPQTLTFQWNSRDGRPIWIEQRATGIPGADGRTVAVQGILRDITDRIVAERERDRLEHQLHQSERMESLGRLAGGVAHDFNNLLAVIGGYAELLTAAIPAGDPLRPDAEGIIDAADRAATLTRQLLIFSRLEPHSPEIIDLNAVVASTQQLLQRTLGEDIDMVTALEPGLPPITADRGRIEQVIMNLVVNARSAMPRGGRLTITTAAVPPAALATTTAPSDEGYLRLTVTDTGCGMTTEVLQHAFEPFFTTKPRGEGTGIGLATVYGAVTEAGGHVDIQSAVGSGTTFHVYLPATDRPSVADRLAPPPAGSARDQTILLVEDEDAVRDITARILTRAGFRVVQALSPEEALDLYRDANPSIDAVLTDAVMPGMSGPQLIEQLRRTRPGLPVLLMSGYSGGAAPTSPPPPADIPLIQKPFKSHTLLARLSGILHTS
jgi:hypothetical protein